MRKNVTWSLIAPFVVAAAMAVSPASGEVVTSIDTISRSELEKLPVQDLSALIATMPTVRGLPKREAGVHLFYQDVTALTPGFGSSISGYDGAVLGAGGHVTFRPNEDSGFFIRGGAGYGVGSETNELGGSFSFTDKVSFKALYGNFGGGYIAPITKSAALYGQGSAFYSSTSATFDNGTNEEDGAAFKVFGLDTGLGMRVNIGSKNSLFIEQYSQFGWGSGDDEDATYKGSVKYGCFRGGMNIGL